MSDITLLESQREFLEIPHNHKLDVALYQGGFGSGKTFSGSLLGILLCIKYPGIRGLSGASTLSLLKDTTIKTYFELLEQLGFYPKEHYEFQKSIHTLVFKNGSEILFRHLENPERLKSLNLGFCQIEEMSQIPKSSFEMLLSRMRQTPKEDWENFRYRIFGHTNPESSKGWIYKTFVRKKPDNYRLIVAPTTQNTHLDKSFVESLKEAYDDDYFRINVLGEFGDYSKGLVVKNFEEDNVKSIHYQSDLDLHISCDFNVDPMAWCLAHKSSEKVYFFDEIVLENTTTLECIDEFYSRYPNHKGRIIINGDASGKNRHTSSEYTNYVLMKRRLAELGYKKVEIKIKGFNPPIKNRIASFNSKVKNANGQRFIYIDPKCKWLIYNCQNLKYKEGTSTVDAPTYSRIKASRELKFLSHPFDAASYLVDYYWPIG